MPRVLPFIFLMSQYSHYLEYIIFINYLLYLLIQKYHIKLHYLKIYFDITSNPNITFSICSHVIKSKIETEISNI